VKAGRNIRVPLRHVRDVGHAFHSEVSYLLAGLVRLCPQVQQRCTGKGLESGTESKRLLIPLTGPKG
jgi:hypothetical protein